MITGREDVVARHFDQACQLSQRGAFVIIGMAKTEIDAVPLIIKFWMPGSRPLDKLSDPLQFFLAFRSKTFEAIRIVNTTRLCFLSHEVYYLGEDWLGGSERISAITGARI